MGFPLHRPRRTRQSDAWRRMVRETRLTLDSLIYPMFIVPGRAVRHPIGSMPGISQLSVDEAVKEARAVVAAGIPAVLLFAAPAQKDSKASAALDPKGIAAQAIAAIKDACPNLIVWADVCLCSATDHGHCGHVTSKGQIENDSSVETLAQVALNYARAGADAVAPSDMMDGRVLAMRNLLIVRASRKPQLFRMRSNTRRRFTDRFGKLLNRLPRLGTGGPTRWTRRTGAKRFERRCSTWMRARISLS